MTFPRFSRFTGGPARNLLLTSLMAVLLPHLAQGASICDGLRPNQTQSLVEGRNTLASVPQLPNQFKVTGCWEESLYSDRPACRREDKYGELNGRFGSCATFTAFSAATAIARRLHLKILSSLEYNSENLVRIFDQYGNPWDTETPGIGSFPHILDRILQEWARHPSVGTAQRRMLGKIAQSYSYREIREGDRGNRFAPSTQALLKAVATHFNAEPEDQLLPVELIFDGWILDRPIEDYCPVRASSGECDESRGSDQREAHSGLIVGRRLIDGRCEVQVRNSWKGCSHGRYGNADRDCDRRMDTIWVPEDELVKGISAVRVRE